LADWDPFTSPIICEREGIVQCLDLIDGVSLKEAVDESTGVTTYVVADWRQQARYADLKPRIILKDEKGNPIVLPSGQDIKYFLSVDSVIVVNNGDKVKVGDVLARMPRESSKTKDITGGLPRVSELFEARVPKDPAIISEFDGRVEFGKDYKGKKRIIVHTEDPTMPHIEYLVPRWRQVAVREGDVVSKGEILIEGNKDPHDILKVMGFKALAEYLINEIQDVYRLQGVKINDKHIEIIVRQMLRKVRITNPGDTDFLWGEQITRQTFLRTNEEMMSEGRRPAEAQPALLGITKAALETDSFISAASFQDTTRVLTEAATMGRVDELRGFKENVILGHTIPGGTGFPLHRHLRLVPLCEPISDADMEELRAEAKAKQDEIFGTTPIPPEEEGDDEPAFEPVNLDTFAQVPEDQAPDQTADGYSADNYGFEDDGAFDL
jgi:DNA-directed RNA polymerase subunit beta'